MTADDREFEIEGRLLRYPASFRDGSSIMGLFSASAARVQRLLEHTPFVAARPLPGRAVLGINCVHYTDTDCGSYDEVAMSVFVEPFEGPSRVPYLPVLRSILGAEVPSFAWRLGVDTTLSRDCGLRMWGFPKELAELHWSRTHGRARMAWRDEGATVLELAVPARGTKESGPLESPVYSVIGGAAHVGRLRQSYRGVGHHRRGVELLLGDHPIADELRAAGISGRPLLGVWNEHLEFRMSAPTSLRGPDRDESRPGGGGGGT